MKYLFWCSGVSALVLGFILLRSSQPILFSSQPIPKPVPQPPPFKPLSLIDQAQASANRDRLKAAIALVDQVSSTDPTYATAQQLRELWARELLQRAIHQYAQNQVPIALKMLAAIPVNTSSYSQSAPLLALWQQEATISQAAASSPKTSTPIKKAPAIATIAPILPPPIAPVPVASPPQLPAMAPPSETARQEDEKILATLSTLPAHWREPRAATPAEIAAWASAAPPPASQTVDNASRNQNREPIPTAIAPPIPTPSLPEFSPPSFSSRINVLPPDATSQ
jgi:hypothetical protein